MSSLAQSLAASLPKPKYTGEDEEIPSHAQQRGPRIVGPGQIDESQIVLRVSLASRPHCMASADFPVNSKPDLRRTATDQDGDRELPRTLATGARSPRSPSHNTP